MGIWIVGIGAVVGATVLIFAYLAFIWWLDRYEREPFWLVLVTFGWGAVGATALGCLISLVMSIPAYMILPQMYSDAFSAVVAAPLAEEFTKGLIFLALVFTPHLDNETDGLIYGAAVGLGFACVENLLYFASAAVEGPGALIVTVVVRTLFTALVHAISSALLGYAVGYVRHRKLWPWLWTVPLLGFAAAVLNHGVWNFLVVVTDLQLFGEVAAVGAFGISIVFVPVMALLMFAITQFSLWREHKIIARYLEDEARRGTLPHPHAQIIPYWLKRRKKNWLSPNIPRKEYVEAATLLAFRRYQQDTAAEKHRMKYEGDVQKYRNEVRRLLSMAAPHPRAAGAAYGSGRGPVRR